MRLLLLRPYYGITVHSDMHGDLGVCDYLPQAFPDLSLVYAATIASKNKAVDLEVIDANAEKLLPGETMARLGKAYDFIVLKAAAPTVKYDIEFAKELKKRFPEAKLAMAGHAAKILERWLGENVPEIDEVAAVPMEYYVNGLVNNAWGAVHMDDIPSPDYTLFPYEKFVYIDGTLRGCVHMSRGCAVGCTYCPYTAFYGKRFETRDLKNVIADIKQLLALGITTIQFRDQYFTCNRERVAELCRMIIREKLKFNWRCETRLESLNTELIDLMVQAGMDMICFGVESASEKTLESFERPACNASKVKKLIQYLNEKNVTTLAFYIIGFPEDTWESVMETYQLANELGSTYAKFSIYTPYLSGDEDASLEITPDLFEPFENNLAVNSCRNLTAEQVKFLLNQVSIMQHTHSKGLKDAYDYHHVNQRGYAETIRKLQKTLEGKSILEI